MNLQLLQNLYKTHKETALYGRYIFSQHLKPLIKKHSDNFLIETIGQSVLGENISVIKIGSGKTKILMRSQMHGNESTTTKAVLDLCNLFNDSSENEIKSILKACTIAIIPMLNPDGAKAYTRLNANEIDLNRDAQDLSQPESVALRTFFNKFKPDFCFNLHGQRTIFSAGNINKPATVSFLAPAQDEACTVTDNRKIAMTIIVKMNKNLQLQIPKQVGIYDDAFNINCVGDTFQSYSVPTVLFEAGHFEGDYNREVVREYIFQSLLIAIHCIASNQLDGEGYEDYFKIPENEKRFYDIIIRNAKVELDNKEQILDIAIQYQETLVDNELKFIPKVEQISDLKHFFGHNEIDAEEKTVLNSNKKNIAEGNENDFVYIGNEIFSIIL